MIKMNSNKLYCLFIVSMGTKMIQGERADLTVFILQKTLYGFLLLSMFLKAKTVLDG